MKSQIVTILWIIAFLLSQLQVLQLRSQLNTCLLTTVPPPSYGN